MPRNVINNTAFFWNRNKIYETNWTYKAFTRLKQTEVNVVFKSEYFAEHIIKVKDESTPFYIG